ncbi:MAG: hypothetical protein AAFQ98_27160, partial [Bacteroidota bacterium]
MKNGLLLIALLGVSFSTFAQEQDLIPPPDRTFHELGTTLLKVTPLSEGVLSQEVIGNSYFIRPFFSASNLQYKHVSNRTALRASVGRVRANPRNFGIDQVECIDCSSATGGYSGFAVSVGGEYRFTHGNAVVYPFL